MDYGRYKYELKKKESIAKKSQHQMQIKEIKVRPRINEHDLDVKLRSARKFLFEGDKVKCTCMFRGREIVHTDAGRVLLTQVAERLAEIVAPETPPRMEGRMMSFTLAPNRAAIDKIKKQEKKNTEAEESAAEPEAPAADTPPEAVEE